MYEHYYGFAEKPFSLTPDPKYLFRSQSHASAFDLLQYAVRRREGFAVVTGDIGTGKTTLCRALLEEIDRTTFTALVLNPFLTEEDLLKRILQDFGVLSREEAKSSAMASVSKQELVETLYDFLLSLVPLKASAVLIIDEAQNLPLRVLEQIRILSNLETDKEKLLQIILVGQLNLHDLLRSPDLRQLDQRVSIRYQLTPLDREAVGGYITHRLTIAGGGQSVSFAPEAVDEVHRFSNGIPRLINLVCDRALLGGYSQHTNRITPELVAHAAAGLDLGPSASLTPRRRAQTAGFARRNAPILAAASVVAAASLVGATATAVLYQRFVERSVEAQVATPVPSPASTPIAPAPSRRRPTGSVDSHQLPRDAALTILVGSYPLGAATSGENVRAMTDWLETSGFEVFYAEIDLGPQGHWQRVLAGAYTDAETARRDAARIIAAAPQLDAHVISADAAGAAPIAP
ncbi:MAG TPA: AAA family ATPase [Vicinamibacterales bacterium]|jgi:type II secretory pathway predicted ATPase ExeA/cell division septation protein DedD